MYQTICKTNTLPIWLAGRTHKLPGLQTGGNAALAQVNPFDHLSFINQTISRFILQI